MLNIIAIIAISIDTQMENTSIALYSYFKIFLVRLIIVEITLPNTSSLNLIMIPHLAKVRESRGIVYFGT